MSVLDVLSGVATAAGKGYEGYGVDQQLGVKNALAQAKAAQEAERERVLNQLTMRQVAKPQLGDANFAKLSGDVKGAEASAETPALVSRAAQMAPIEVKKAGDIASAEVAPHVKQAVDIAKESPDKPSVSIQAPLEAGAPAQAVIVTPGDHPTVKALPVPGVGKSASGGIGARGFGQGGIFGGASGLGSINEMHAASPRLKSFEAGLLSEAPGSPTLKMFDTYRTGVLNAARHAGQNFGDVSGAISSFVNSGAAEEMARINPQLGAYARNLAQWIVADLNLTRNASDERGRMDQIASSVLALPVSDMPFANRRDYIHGIWEGRNGRLSGLDKVVPAAESMLEGISRQSGHAPHAAAPSNDPEFDALLAKHQKP